MGVLDLDPDHVSTASIVLLPVTALYTLSWMAYESVYRLGLKRPSRIHSPVVCVGNLTVGGMGKTPLTIHVAEVLASLGQQVVISENGYGSAHQQGATLAPSGPLDPKEWGDEPALVRERLPDTPMVVGRQRADAAALVHQQFPNAVLLMDDGVQHLPVHRDVTILVDPPNPRNAFCIPSGPYREPRHGGRKKADLILPGEFRVDSVITGIDGDVPSEGSDVQILTAIARPYRFQASVEAMGFRVTGGKFLPDHHPLQGILSQREINPKVHLLTTAKDWVKLRSQRDAFPGLVGVVQVASRIEPAEQFRAWLENKVRGFMAEKA
ncbi:MAG: tetraacyldisaccharide 4'-kinase [Fimbriimonadaceae bacterium]|nr:tetraacyldisaccharide 4'-kinase [Fimbriimonadaceae bacterium]